MNTNFEKMDSTARSARLTFLCRMVRADHRSTDALISFRLDSSDSAEEKVGSFMECYHGNNVIFLAKARIGAGGSKCLS